MNRIIVLLILLMGITLTLCGEEITALSTHSGVVNYSKEHVFLQAGNANLLMLLAPQSYMDSLNLELATGDTLAVDGWVQEDKILVAKLTDSQGKVYRFRDPETMANNYPDHSTIKVDNKKCIACRLCIKPCPTGAISIKAGKAFIDPSKCVECGVCIDGHAKFKGCPVGAIK